MRTSLAPPSLLLPILAFGLLQASAAAEEPNPDYAALRGAHPEGKALAVQNLVLQRDVFRFEFASGTFQFLTPVEGRTLGAVFVGDGAFELKPATEAERRQLAVQAGEKDLSTLSDRFDSAVFLFSDATATEIGKKGAPAEASPRAADVYATFFRVQKKDLKENLQIRLLRDLLEAPDQKGGAFLAYVTLKKYPSALVKVDYSLGPDERVTLFVAREHDRGYWYATPGKAVSPPALARHYTIETAVQRNAEIQSTTTMTLEPAVSQLRVLPIRLFEKLRVQEAVFSDADQGPWQPLGVIQEKEDEDSDVAVVFPSPPARGKTVFLRMRYSGKDVLRDMGDGSFAVLVRVSWYPSPGSTAPFSEPSTFDLTYRVPKGNEVISVGRRVEDRNEGDTHVSVWKAAQPIRIAGFNYGKFKKVERDDKDSGIHVEVYTNPGTPDIVHEINGYLASRSRVLHSGEVNPDYANAVGGISAEDVGISVSSERATAGLSSVHVDTDSLAESVLADGINTARVCTAYFGPLPDKHVAITQQTQWFFGQSWPSLIYLPYLAALDGTTRRELGLKGTNDFVEEVGPHEFAHQWWGHLVGSASYHDVWLEEGLAEFSAALVLQATGGGKKFDDYWERARKRILEKPVGATITNNEAGPITQGDRLITHQNPFAYDAIVYSKGAYVMHMLRMLMREPTNPKPDEKFIAMMHDFVESYSGKNPSTRDFQTVVERHMTQAMNAAGDGKMDWFFKHGSTEPTFRVTNKSSTSPGWEEDSTGSAAACPRRVSPRTSAARSTFTRSSQRPKEAVWACWRWSETRQNRSTRRCAFPRSRNGSS